MKKIFCLFLLLLNFILPLYADSDNKDRLIKAMDFYDLGNYNNAIKIYETLLDEGIVNSTIYYNLAVSYLKNKEIGKAKLNLERVLRLTPRDKSARELKNYISEITEEPKQNLAEKIISDIKLICSLNEITLIMFIFFFVAGSFFIVYCLLYKKIYIRLSIAFFCLFLLLVPLIYMKIEDEILSSKAIVMDYAEVRNNPIKLEDPSFEILEGRKVIILSELGRWVNIKLEIEGLSGWVDKHFLEKI